MNRSCQLAQWWSAPAPVPAAPRCAAAPPTRATRSVVRPVRAPSARCVPAPRRARWPAAQPYRAPSFFRPAVVPPHGPVQAVPAARPPQPAWVRWLRAAGRDQPQAHAVLGPSRPVARHRARPQALATAAPVQRHARHHLAAALLLRRSAHVQATEQVVLRRRRVPRCHPARPAATRSNRHAPNAPAPAPHCRRARCRSTPASTGAVAAPAPGSAAACRATAARGPARWTRSSGRQAIEAGNLNIGTSSAPRLAAGQAAK